MKISWTEVAKFLKNNVLKMLIGAILGAVAVVGFSLLNKDNTIENLRDAEDGTFSTTVLPAKFNVYIEDNQDNPFINNLLLQEEFTTPQVLAQVSEETNTNLNELVENTLNRVYVDYTPAGHMNIVSVTRNGSSQIHEIAVNVGDIEENLNIANYYFDYLLDGNVSFLEDKEIYVFREPTAFEQDDEQNSGIGTNLNGNGSNLIVLGLAGAVFGAVATLFLMFFLALFSKKLVYSFSYFVHENNYFVLVNNKSDKEEQLDLLLGTPQTANKVAVIENTASNEATLGRDSKGLTVVNHVLEIGNLDAVDRLVLIIEEGQTTREWYNTQRILAEKHAAPIYIVQINQ